VANLGEYGGFFLAYHIAPSQLVRLPSTCKNEYLAAVQEHAAAFARSRAKSSRQRFFLDSTPWNLLIATRLAEHLENAVFVLVLRHYAGVLQSLQRSYTAGYEWAGKCWADRARLWQAFYLNAMLLPSERTIVTSYDSVCAAPQEAIDSLDKELASYEIRNLDRREFTRSHATNLEQARQTVGYLDARRVRFRAISSFDATHWSEEIEREVLPLVHSTDMLLRERFSTYYRAPVSFSGHVG
jgi:hypothetical protein